jgi:hypothetical protein
VLLGPRGGSLLQGLRQTKRDLRAGMCNEGEDWNMKFFYNKNLSSAD